MMQKKYSNEQELLFKKIVSDYKSKGYAQLKELADIKFSDTEHPGKEAQIGINVFYDDKKIGNVRCTFSLSVIDDSRKWWKFWDSPVLKNDFIIRNDGSFIGE